MPAGGIKSISFLWVGHDETAPVKPLLDVAAGGMLKIGLLLELGFKLFFELIVNIQCQWYSVEVSLSILDSLSSLDHPQGSECPDDCPACLPLPHNPASKQCKCFERLFIPDVKLFLERRQDRLRSAGVVLIVFQGFLPGSLYSLGFVSHVILLL